MKKIVIGSRESSLAVAQSMTVVDAIRKALPDAQVSLLTMKTTGDRILDRTLDQIGGKGLFVKELGCCPAGRQGRSDGSQPEGPAHGSAF
jgi:hydroxymethylbilane synthase (EC 2.5.1.61)